MKRSHVICLWVAAALGLAGGTLPLLPALVTWVNRGVLFSTSTMFSLYVAVYTLEATLLIAAMIYSLQSTASNREAKRREANAKRIVLTELEAGLESVIRCPAPGSNDISSYFSELFLAYLPEMKGCLSSEQLHRLIKQIDILVHAAQLAVTEDAGVAAEYERSCLPFFVEERFIPALRSPYAGRFSDLDDFRCVLDPMTRSILEVLSGKNLPPVAGNFLRAAEGGTLLEMTERGHIRFYGEDGQLLCDAVFDSDSADNRGIASGWAKLWDYEGEFQAGLRHGRGRSYSAVYRHKLFDGVWVKGEPTDGTRFDIVCKMNPDADDTYEEQFPYWKDYSMVESNLIDYVCDSEEFDWKQLFVGDVQISGGKADVVHLRPLSDFIQAEDPVRLERINGLLDEIAVEVGEMIP